jgi:type I restriction enzyme S subunit
VKGGKRVPAGYKLLVEPTKFPYLRVTDFNESGTIDMRDLRYISADVHREIKNYIINSADMYVSIAGTIGKTGIIPKELDGANLTENACRLVFRSGINNRFVYYFTKTPDFVEQAGLNTRTAAQPKLALSRLSTIRLGIPPVGEQELLVHKFDSLRTQTQCLEALYRQKLDALETLKKSLLHQAFSGRL